jgi:RNA polymerase sigma-70 factor (ECF subfamily)
MVKPQDSRMLVEAAKAGDREAFEKLVSRERPRIRALVGSRLHAHIVLGVSADDVYQETLLRACQSIGRFEWKGKDSFLRWLGGIAENIILHLARKRARERSEPLEEDVPAREVSPSRAVRREERFQRLEDALDELSLEHRKVIRLVILEGLTFDEAARRMDRSREAIKRLLYRALRNLKSVFGDTESLHLPDLALGSAEEACDE